jgi:non-canonical purine NTP pyrophosphatase (RdgB/HAM1 family)
MAKLYFITGNKNKFEELSKLIPNLEMLEMDLPEIQETNARHIIEAKLKEALKKKKGAFIVEDTSLCLDCINGLPGPLIKWFVEKIGVEGVYNIANKFGNTKAKAVTMIGYAKNPKEIHYFEGCIEGELVAPTGTTGFGWDSIFKPEGYVKSFQQMTREEKGKISMRAIAAKKLNSFLKK